MLDVIGVDYDYPDKALLRQVHFSLSSGCLLHLRGKNGSGKTTLLKLLGGLLPPTQGEIHYNGQRVTDNMNAYRHNICYVGHKTGVSQLLTVRENYRFELKNTSRSLSFDELIKAFSLFDQQDVACGLLSFGLQRRVGLMRLLMSNALLWLLDEPLIALDKDAVQMFNTCLVEHLANGGQVVLTSHQNLPLGIGEHQEYCL